MPAFRSSSSKPSTLGNSISIGCATHNATFSLVLKFHSFVGGFNWKKIHMYRSACRQPTYVRHTLVHIGWKRIPSGERENRNPCVQEKLRLQFMHVPLIMHVQLECFVYIKLFSTRNLPTSWKKNNPLLLATSLATCQVQQLMWKALTDNKQLVGGWTDPFEKCFKLDHFPNFCGWK